MRFPHLTSDSGVSDAASSRTVLRIRVITAVCIAPLAVAAMYLLALDWFALVFWILAALGAYEWAGLARLPGALQRGAYVGVFAVLAWFTYGHSDWYVASLWFAVALWSFAIVVIVAFPASAALVRTRLVVGVLGLAMTWCAWIGLVVIRQSPDGSHWLLWMFVLVWGVDVGAYFAGRRFGNHKLATAISPAKTWEGVAGGALLSLVVCGSALALVGVLDVLMLAVIGLMIAVSVFGDLFESLLKRASGVKDSGTLLPGHGGALDRIDSVLAVSPMFDLVLTYL